MSTLDRASLNALRDGVLRLWQRRARGNALGVVTSCLEHEDVYLNG
jgi:hypothetical protein